MCMKLRSRLNWVEWSLLGMMVPYLAFGLFTNYWRVRPFHPSAPISPAALYELMFAGLAVMVAVVIAALATRRIDIRTLGFYVSKRTWLDVLLIIVSTIVASRQTVLGFHAGNRYFYFAVAGASLEEVFFRAIVIGLLLKIFGVNWRTILGVVVFGAALFALGHIPSHSWIELQGVFIGAVIFGYIFTYTRSILFVAFYHVLSNTAGQSGLLGAVIWLLFFGIVVGVAWGIGRIRRLRVVRPGI